MSIRIVATLLAAASLLALIPAADADPACVASACVPDKTVAACVAQTCAGVTIVADDECPMTGGFGPRVVVFSPAVVMNALCVENELNPEGSMAVCVVDSAACAGATTHTNPDEWILVGAYENVLGGAGVFAGGKPLTQCDGQVGAGWELVLDAMPAGPHVTDTCMGIGTYDTCNGQDGIGIDAIVEAASGAPMHVPLCVTT